MTMKGKLSKKELQTALQSRLGNETSLSLLSKSDEDEALDLLTEAFLDDPMSVWVAALDETKSDPGKDDKMRRLVRYMQAWVNCRLISGSRGAAYGIRSSANGKELVGFMSVAPCSCVKEGMFETLMTLIKIGSPPTYSSKKKGNYGPSAQKRLERLEELHKARAEKMKDTNRWIYIQTFGVSPEQQGKGHGKKLMQVILECAESLGASVYLETESEKNQSMYHHFGFRTLEKLDISVPGDDSSTSHLTNWLMRKDPNE
eukprot:CAMPEP_0183784808 /NCGR_PEP_ID=MMETSP0739-20130205/66178_1 /TAXON_ID=385413 /ORGANISM="Thalassiosira miniscula, Strain CCMP1093" /LENGTH=258 /DNA_ID=CAMNT_0026028793 /DNA_START=58 /DNA_END=834 /DNA_ORIENTATION=+